MSSNPEDGGINLSDGVNVEADLDAMDRLLKARTKIEGLEKMVRALNKDRREMLDQLLAIRDAREVPTAPCPSDTPRADSTRVSVGDVHGMRQDPKAVAIFLKDLKTLEPEEIILGGDMLECGGWLAKHQPIGFVSLLDYSYQEDVNATNAFLDACQHAAPNAVIEYIEGNHEDRVERWIVDQVSAHARDAEFLRQIVSPEALLRLEARGIPYYRRSVVYEDGCPRGWIKRGKMYFTHQLGKSKNAASDSVASAAGNVTFFHTHREDASTRVFPSVGLVKAFNPGCLCTMQPVWQNSDPTNWAQGYAIDFIARSGMFQRVHVPIWRGTSLAGAMVERFKS